MYDVRLSKYQCCIMYQTVTNMISDLSSSVLSPAVRTCPATYTESDTWLGINCKTQSHRRETGKLFYSYSPTSETARQITSCFSREKNKIHNLFLLFSLCQEFLN